MNLGMYLFVFTQIPEITQLRCLFKSKVFFYNNVEH